MTIFFMVVLYRCWDVLCEILKKIFYLFLFRFFGASSSTVGKLTEKKTQKVIIMHKDKGKWTQGSLALDIPFYSSRKKEQTKRRKSIKTGLLSHI